MKKELIDLFNTLKTSITNEIAEIKALVKKPEVKNTSASLSDGTTIYFAEDTLAVGIAVFSDEAMSSPCADGSYVTGDGATLEIKGGKVEALDLEQGLEAMTAENTALKAEVADLKNQLSVKSTEITNVQTRVEAIQTKLNEFALMVPGDGDMNGGKKKVDNENPITAKLNKSRQIANSGK